MVIDSLFICFCEDFDENDGTVNPYYTSPKLLNTIQGAYQTKLRQKEERDARRSAQN